MRTLFGRGVHILRALNVTVRKGLIAKKGFGSFMKLPYNSHIKHFIITVGGDALGAPQKEGFRVVKGADPYKFSANLSSTP